jgi:DNA-binding beta-propeller fold protein YncE
MIVTKTVVRLFGLAKATCGVANAPGGGGPSRGGGWEAGVRGCQMFGKQRAESVDNADGKFSGLEVCKKGGFHMRSLRTLRIVGIGLAFAAILASGGLPVGSQAGQQELPPFIVTVSYPDNAVAFIDLLPDGRTTVTQVTVAQGPIGLAVHPERSFTYVVSWDANVLTVIDNKTRRAVGTVSLGEGANPYSVAVRPDGRAVYVVLAGIKQVAVLDTSDAGNPRLLTRLALSGSQAPRNIAFSFSLERQRAFISDSESGQIQIIDAITHQRIGQLDTGGRCAIGVKVSNFGHWLYVADRCLSTIYAIEVESLSSARPAITPIPLSPRSGAWYIAFSPDDRFAYVSLTEPRNNTSSGQIAIIDTEQKRQIGTIAVGGFPAGLQMIVKTPVLNDPTSWQYMLLVFNPGASVQQQPIDSTTGQPRGQTTTVPTGLTKNLTGQPSCDALTCHSPETPPPCEYKVVEVKGNVDFRPPGADKSQPWKKVRGPQTIPAGSRVTTGYKAFAKIEVWCGGKHVATYLLYSIGDVTLNEARLKQAQVAVDSTLKFGVQDVEMKKIKEVTADIKVKSEFSTTSIRGTVVKVVHELLRDLIFVAEGEAEVTSISGQKTTLKGPGDCKTVVQVTVDDQGQISPIETLPFEPEDWLLMECPKEQGIVK